MSSTASSQHLPSPPSHHHQPTHQHRHHRHFILLSAQPATTCRHFSGSQQPLAAILAAGNLQNNIHSLPTIATIYPQPRTIIPSPPSITTITMVNPHNSTTIPVISPPTWALSQEPLAAILATGNLQNNTHSLPTIDTIYPQPHTIIPSPPSIITTMVNPHNSTTITVISPSLSFHTPAKQAFSPVAWNRQ
jgi:hypothetical protein